VITEAAFCPRNLSVKKEFMDKNYLGKSVKISDHPIPHAIALQNQIFLSRASYA
jgi:hypothetical protein